MGGCQNYGPLLGTANIKCRIIIGIQNRTIILTTTHMVSGVYRFIISLFPGNHQQAAEGGGAQYVATFSIDQDNVDL